MTEKKTVTVAGVPVTAEAAGGVLTVTIGRFDPAAGGLLLDPHSGTAVVGGYIAGETGNPAHRTGQRCLGLFDLHPSPPGAAQTLLLCDGCYQGGTGLLAECEDGCPHDLDHTGLCLRESPDECQWCGKPDRLREVLRADIEHRLPTVGEEDEGLWWLHSTDGAQGPFPSGQAAWDYWHGNPPPPARTPAASAPGRRETASPSEDGRPQEAT